MTGPVRRRPPRPSPLLALGILVLILTACAQGPREIHVGAEECAHCRMLLTDDRFAAQLLTDRGRHYVFDSIECMAEFLDSNPELDGEALAGLWVTDFPEPGRWVPVDEAHFLHADELRSPMGMNLSAHARTVSAEDARQAFGGEILDWDEVRSLVRGTGGSGEHDHGMEPVASDHEAGHMPATDAARDPDADHLVGPGERFERVSDALAAAQPGDRIRVQPGVYQEGPILVDRPVELIGEGRPVLDGQGEHTILTVTADSVRIEGFVLRNSGASHTRDHAAILVEDATDCRIENNRLEDNHFGIYLARAHDCGVRQNEIVGSATREATSGNGIQLWDVDRVLVEDNRVRGHRDGIYLEFAREAVIRNNRSEDNLRYGLHFMFSDASFYVHNTFARNGAGVAVMYSSEVVMSRNRFLDNWGTSAYGLLLKEVQDSRIDENLFRGNTIAIHSEGTDRLTFRLNQIERNGWAVKIHANSQDNLFSRNNFVGNSFDVVTNSRQNPNRFDGNYWSQYRGYDLEGDGTGDQAHRPVRLFSFIIESRPVALILLRSFFVDILEVAERVLPVLTPEALADDRPLMTPVPGDEPWR